MWQVGENVNDSTAYVVWCELEIIIIFLLFTFKHLEQAFELC